MARPRGEDPEIIRKAKAYFYQAREVRPVKQDTDRVAAGLHIL